MEYNPEDKPTRVAMYIRVSTEDQVEKFGPEVQKAAIEGLVKSKGTSMVLAGEQYVYFDEGISGTIELESRPEFARLMDDVRDSGSQKPFDVVAVFKLDRFARKLRILLDVIEYLKKNNIDFISTSESIDTSTPYGRAMVGIMGAIAELELETIMERTQQGKLQANKKGIVMGANAKYGYYKDKDKKLQVLEDEAKIVRRIYDEFIVNKFTTQKIADGLASDKIDTPDISALKHNKRSGESRRKTPPYFWRAERVTDILKDEIYTGVKYFDMTKNEKRLPKEQWKRADFDHPYIILRDYWLLAQEVLKEVSDRKLLTKRKQDNTVYLLSSLLKCDHCRKLASPPETNMITWAGTRKKISSNSDTYSYYYQCGRKNVKKFGFTCPVVPIPSTSIEEYVIKFVHDLLQDPKAAFEYQNELKSNKLLTKHLQGRHEDLVKGIKGCPKRRENVLYQHEQGYIDRAVLNEKLNEVNQSEVKMKGDLAEIDRRLSTITLSKGYEASLELYSKKYTKAFDKLSEDKTELYDLVHMMIDQIVVFSRPVKEDDVIAGRKKQSQMIPERVDIFLNLPQHLLQQLYSQKFVVKHENLWAAKDLNP